MCPFFGSVSEEFQGFVQILGERLKSRFTRSQAFMLGNSGDRITDWRMSASASKSRMLLRALQLGTRPQGFVLSNIENRITEWRMCAGATKSRMLLRASQLVVSMQLDGIGPFLTESRKMVGIDEVELTSDLQLTPLPYLVRAAILAGDSRQRPWAYQRFAPRTMGG